MTLNNKQTNHFLALFMDDCYHEWKLHEDMVGRQSLNRAISTCIHCGVDKRMYKNNNFFTPEGFFKLKEYAEKEQANLWEEYLLDTFRSQIIRFSIYLNKVLDPTNFAEFLKANRESWEWIECPQCHGAWLETAHPAILKSCGCKGGKVLHQAARYLDSLKEEII